MRPEIYIDGQPFKGIGELKAEHMIDPETPPEVAKVAGPAEAVLHANIMPGVVFQTLTESTRKAAAAFRELVVSAKRLSGVIEAEIRAINPRWYHMSKRAKKLRTRKKYRSRIEREWLRREKKAVI